MFEVYLSNNLLKALKKLRIIYKVEWEKKEINVIKIARRDEKTYKRL